ncbi:MAG: hypothetical protein IJT14_02510 [Rickettsiales bacterium]|nr:hypothetical protein [Rickettsiales bacterium]
MADTKAKFFKAFNNNQPKKETKTTEELMKEQEKKTAQISLKNKNRLNKTQSIA